MKKQLTLIGSLFFLSIIIRTLSFPFGEIGGSSLYAQNIGINGSGAFAHPSALLDVDAASTPSLGILIPRIALQAINLAAPVSSPATSLLIYNTASASTGTNVVSPGYYYWDGVKWVRFAYNASGSFGDAWTTLGNAGTNPSTNFLGTIDTQDLVFRTNNLEAVRINTLGYVGIGTNTPNYKLDTRISDATAFTATNNATWYGSKVHNTNTTNATSAGMTLRSNTFDAGIFAITDGALNGGRLAFVGDNPQVETMTIWQDKVGINTTTPANKLEITQGTAGNSGLRFTNLPNASALGTSSLGDVIPVTAATATSNGVYWGLLGNSGTIAGTNFLGTTDNQDLIFKRNNVQSGLINSSLGATSYGVNALNPLNTGNSNSAFGTGALQNNSTGYFNTAVGTTALSSNTTGFYNTAIGDNALVYNISGSNNVSLGANSTFSNSTGSNNTSSGAYSMFSNISGSDNTASGFYSLSSNTTGSLNVAVGSSALYSNVSGLYNTAVGAEALRSSTTINESTAIGGKALRNNTTGSVNTAVGGEALLSNTTGNSNTGIGHSSLRLNNGNRNSGLGYLSLTSNTTGNDNTAVGFQALRKSTTPNNNTAIGSSALVENTSGANNTALGANASFSNTTGNENVSVGTNALSYNQDGSANVAIGFNSLFSIPAATFSNNTAVGWKTLEKNTANYNAAFGAQTMKNNTTGTRNAAFGTNALFSNNSGTNNSSIGFESMLLNTTGSENATLGYHSLANNTIGSNNTAIGRTSLENTLGNNNTGLGYYSGFNNTNGFNNTFLGANADATAATFTNATAIGYNAKVAASNALILGGTGADAVNVGIGTTLPTHEIDILSPSPSIITRDGSGFGGAYFLGNLNHGLIRGNLASAAIGFTPNPNDVTLYTSGLGLSNLHLATGPAGSAIPRLTILDNGNVGIGTLTPDFKLNIETTDASLVAGYGKVLKIKSSHPAMEFEGTSGGKSGFITYDSQAITEGMKFFVNQTPGILVNTPLLTLKSNQNVGIGTTTPAYKLEVAGGTVAGFGAYVNTSDRRKKQNIKTLTFNAMEVINKLNPVSYEWIEQSDLGMKGTQMGFIAQELEEVLPTMVITKDDADKTKAIKSTDLLPVLVKALQEQQAKIDELEKKIEALEKK